MSKPAPAQTFQPAPQVKGVQPSGLLQRQCACGNHTVAGGECAECAKKKSAGILQRSPSGLAINRPGDRYEQEAERVAAAVTRGGVLPGATLSSVPTLHRDASESDDLSVAPPIVHDVLSSPGRPLDPAMRAFMEPRFGHDFSAVRVHTDAQAAESARAVSANAYTVGKDVVFGAGRFAPETRYGRQLIAHELTHTIQQNGLSKSVLATEKQKLGIIGGWLQRDENRELPPGAFDVPTLDQVYNAALLAARRTGNWQDAAEKLNGFNHIDIQKRLATLSTEEIGRIHLAAVGNPRVGPESNIAQLTSPGLPRSSSVPSEERMTKAPIEKSIAELFSSNFTEIQNNPQYIDNFTNEVKDAWYPNDRVFVFQYPNDTYLKIGLPDLLKALSIPSDLNPQPNEAELRKKYKIPEDLQLPKSTSPTPLITVGKTNFYRDKEFGVIFPEGIVRQMHLPRIADAVKQIESTRENEELWQRAAPKVLEAIINMEWSAPRGFGALIVSAGKGVKRAAKSLIKPPRLPASAPKEVGKDLMETGSKATIKHSATPETTKLPEPIITGKGTQPGTPTSKGNALADITDETEIMFKAKPEIKKALEGSPRAARALKKCKSPCYPDHLSPTQVDRLERTLEAAENSGIYYSEKQLTEFLRGKKDWKELEDGLDELDKSLLRAREVHGELGQAGKQIGGDRSTPAGRPATSTARAQPGTTKGGDNLPEINGQWFPEIRDATKGQGVTGTKDIRIAQIPGQIAKRIRNMSFKNFDEFRETVWKMVAADPVLKQGWSAQNLKRMQDGLAPRVPSSQKTGGGSNAVYQINHKQAIKNAGDVYDLDNLEVVGPAFHVEIGE